MGEPTLSSFFEAWPLFRDAALGGAIAGALLGLMGVYVVLRRLVFLSAAVSQAAGLGIVVSFWAGSVLPPTAGAALITFAAILLVASDRSAGSERRDVLLGLVWLVGAAGTLAVGTRIVEEVHDVNTLLFGVAVAITPEDFRLVWVSAAALGALHLWWWRGFAAVSVDPDGARVRGLPVRLVDLVLFASLAVAISVTTRVLGALPAFAFSVLPAMAALRLAPNIVWALAVACVIGALEGFWGYAAAYVYELPVGASQVLVGAAAVLAAEVVRRGVGHVRR